MRKLDQKEYNTVNGISPFLKHYPHFHAVLRERREARSRNESLDSFVVLQSFSLDQFGQLGKIEPFALVKELMADQPVCMPADEFFSELQRRLPEGGSYSITMCPVYLPPQFTQCAGCGTFYGTTDCHDVIAWEEHSVRMPLDDFIGRQLWEVRRHLHNLPDAGYFIHPEIQIRNDRFIDMNPGPYFCKLPANENGWVGADEGIGDWYVIQPGDETSYDRIRYFHTSCFEDWITEEIRTEFQQVFKKAGVEIVQMTPVKNEYGSFTYRGPWFMIETLYGTVRIGWRKRVIEIVLVGNWTVNCVELFTLEDVTKSRSSIHAYGYEKAAEYLGTICKNSAAVAS